MPSASPRKNAAPSAISTVTTCTVTETNLSGVVLTDQKYYAFGSQRDSGPVATDHKFTGQKLDGSGLMYYNARYYDPAIGQFVSPDTIVPDPENVLAYNRYMYTLGNPLKYGDPSGHCATKSNGDRDWNDGDCWRMADTITNMWDDTDYWQNRYGDVDVWNDHIAPSDASSEFFASELNMFYTSDAGRNRPQPIMLPERSQDFGDYTSFNVTLIVIDGSLIFDDFGNVFARLGPTIALPGGSVTRGDVMVSRESAVTDIDNLGLSRTEKRNLMQQLLVGKSSNISGGAYFAAVAGSRSHDSGTLTVEAGVGPKPPSVTISPGSTTWHLYTFSIH